MDWTRGVGAFGLTVAEVMSRSSDLPDFRSRLTISARLFHNQNPWFVEYLRQSETELPFTKYHDKLEDFADSPSLLPSMKWPKFFARCEELLNGGWRPSLEAVEGLTMIHLDEFENPKRWVDELVAPKLSDDRTQVVINTTYFVEGRRFNNELSARVYAAEVDLAKDLSAKYLHQTDALPHRVVDALRESRGSLCRLAELWRQQDRASGSGV